MIEREKVSPYPFLHARALADESEVSRASLDLPTQG